MCCKPEVHCSASSESLFRSHSHNNYHNHSHGSYLCLDVQDGAMGLRTCAALTRPGLQTPTSLVLGRTALPRSQALMQVMYYSTVLPMT